MQYRSAGLRRESITVDGHQIFYLVGGDGPPLVLLHGFGADKNHWPQAVRNLTKHFRVYAPDLPGFGESTQLTEARYTGFDQVGRLRLFVEALGLGKIHIGGNSMGGYIAGLYATRYRDHVETLWLLAPAGVLSAERSDLMKLLDTGENPLLIDSPNTYDKLIRLCFTQAPYVPGPFKRCICAIGIENRAFHEKLFADMTSDPQPLEELLTGSTVPTLILWGDEDRILHPSGASLLAASMTNAKVHIMDKMGHVPMLERPVETESLYMEFHQLNQ